MSKLPFRWSTIVNWSLLITSFIISILLAEFAMRYFLFKSDFPFIKLSKNPSYYTIYPKTPNTDFFNEDYWKLDYLLNKKFDLKIPHPLLGWTGFFINDNLIHRESVFVKEKRPILFYGDSFAMCIDSVMCFEDYLNSDTSINSTNYFLNYGVFGYGLDQIYLLFNQTAHQFSKPLIFFSMLTTDLDRSLLKVRGAQKPYFEIINGSIQLKGTPISLSSHDFFGQNPPKINSYLWNRMYNLLPNVLKEDPKIAYDEHLKRSKELNSLILKKVVQELQDLNTEFVFLIFQTAWHSEDDWRLSFLTNFCEQNEIPYLTDVEIRNEAIGKHGYDIHELFIFDDGHPSSLGNKLVSDEIRKYIANPTLIDSLKTSRLH